MALTIFQRRPDGPVPGGPPADPAGGRIGIIDIGSNSIRLVVYDGPTRSPAILFNEKVMVGLGKGLAKDGKLTAGGRRRAMTALGRFAALARAMKVATLRTVATAAVRDASNGAAFLADIRGLGLEVELLSGDEEAVAAGRGVIAGIPEADGFVGDLGGGSLELIRVRDGAVHERLSMPLGVLRLQAIRDKGPRALDRAVAARLARAGWGDVARGLPLYLVGGSWRALARLDMHLTDWPLPILHHYRMPGSQAQRLVRVLAQVDNRRLREVVGLSSSRVPTLRDAAALLATVVRHLGSSELIASAYGLREGILQATLPPAVQAEDPLIAATRADGVREGRFAEHGDLLDRWTASLFADEPASLARLRHAACLLADTGWRAHPEFRADHGCDVALHGNWVGVDARGRAMMAQALYTSFGGTAPVPLLVPLSTPEDRTIATRWGLAMRLGQRLSGGVGAPLDGSRLDLTPTSVRLTLSGDVAALAGEAVERRLTSLATGMGRVAEIVV